MTRSVRVFITDGLLKRRSSLNITISCLLIISETELVWIESNIRVCPSYNNNVIIVNVDRNMVKSRDPRVYLMLLSCIIAKYMYGITVY